jgi:hypothetical protein
MCEYVWILWMMKGGSWISYDWMHEWKAIEVKKKNKKLKVILVWWLFDDKRRKLLEWIWWGKEYSDKKISMYFMWYAYLRWF